ncbi:MAG: hypothetical protein ABID87_08405 [Chloroflexota bacterium]
MSENGDAIEKRLAQRIEDALEEGYLPCRTAFRIAREAETGRDQVGAAANRLNVRIRDCQLGCFDTAKADPTEPDEASVPPALAEALRAALEDSRLPCPQAFRISASMSVTPGDVGDAANRLKLKISHCQLGCFP